MIKFITKQLDYLWRCLCFLPGIISLFFCCVFIAMAHRSIREGKQVWDMVT